MRKVIFMLAILLLFSTMSTGQSLPDNVNNEKLDAKATSLVKQFCDYIIDVGTSSRINRLSLEQKRSKINGTGKLFYNYREDPRRMITTKSNGTSSVKPVYQYMNNLLSQAENYNELRMRQYEIRVDNYYTNGNVDNNWKLERTFSDGCTLYSKVYRIIQTYRIIDILNKNPELRNRDGVDIDGKYMKVYAIVKPGDNTIFVRLGDILRSECLDARRK